MCLCSLQLVCKYPWRQSPHLTLFHGSPGNQVEAFLNKLRNFTQQVRIFQEVSIPVMAAKHFPFLLHLSLQSGDFKEIKKRLRKKLMTP